MVQAAVLARTPISARRVRYVGAGGEAFAAACVARNPHLAMVGPADPPDDTEALAADNLAALLDADGAEALLAQAATVTAAVAAGEGDLAGLLKRLEAHGLEIAHVQPVRSAPGDPAAAGYFDDAARQLTGEAMIVVARRRGADPLMHLTMFSFAPLMMDVRTRLPAAAMRAEPELVVQHVRPPAGLPVVPMDQPKILLLQRPAPPKTPDLWKRSTLEAIRNGWVTVIDFDDHPALTADTNARTVSDADWMRFSGVHAIQTSTPMLEGVLRRLNPETRVFPNAVFDLSAFPEHLPKRVFYGALQRGRHAAEVAASLGPAIAKFPGVEFVVVGDAAVFEALPTVRKRYHGMVPYDQYLELMGSCSVLLSPLEANEKNAAKSDVKFLEAASRGVLTIASPTVYGEVIRHGETGLIAERLGDWATRLSDALGDDMARREMARRAWTYVRDERMFAQQVPERIAWYRDLWARREELNAAVLARL